MSRSICILLPLIWLSLNAQAVNRYVSPFGSDINTPYTDRSLAALTIQSAINISTNGDRIIVTNGTYSSSSDPYQIVSITTGITVLGFNGPSNTIIAPSGTKRGVYISHPNAVLDGFTIQQGQAVNLPGGHGILIAANGLVQNCIIISNQFNAGGFHGGGVYLQGGGILNRCVIRYNSVTPGSDKGGGIFFDNGGIASNCIIEANSAYQGGGVYVQNMGLVRNCSISRNESKTAGYGGGIYCYSGGDVQSCTIVSNTTGGAGQYGGGIYCDNGGMIANSIIYYNSALNPNFDNYGYAAVINWSFTNCCTTPAVSISMGTGNITNPPNFFNYQNGIYHLFTNSPCVNAGTNQPWMDNAQDLDGDARKLYGTVDIGSDEVLVIPAWLNVFPTNLTASCVAGDGNPPDQVFKVWNSGGVAMSYYTSVSNVWLSVVPTNGSCLLETNTHTVSFSAGGMIAGSYSTQIRVTAPGASNSPQYIAVTLNISAPPPKLAINPPGASFNNTVAQGHDASSQSFEVYDGMGDSERLFFSITDDVPWLVTVPSSGLDYTAITILYSNRTMDIGNYDGVIVVTAPGATDSPQYIPVHLHIITDDSDLDGISDTWEQYWFTNLTAAGSTSDFDLDGFPDLWEWLAGTLPRDPLSLLVIDGVTKISGSKVVVSWDSVTDKYYRLTRSLNLVTNAFVPVRTNIKASSDATMATDTLNGATGPVLYRIELEH